MVINFEEITQELTADERLVLKRIVSAFSRKIGAEVSISGKAICLGVNSFIRERRFPEIPATFKLTEPRLRKIVQAIRKEKHLPLLVSNSKGYFIANTDKEVEDCIRSLKQKARATMSSAMALETHYNELKSKKAN